MRRWRSRYQTNETRYHSNDRTGGYQRVRPHRPELPPGGPGQGADVEVVAVNDLTSAETLAHLLRYDSTHGRFAGEVQVVDGHISSTAAPITVLAERDPKALPWGELGVDVVIESTGLFTAREAAAAHLEGGANRVIVSAPATDVDATFVIGVNDRPVRPGHGTWWSPTPRAPPTASCPWSRCSTTPSASRAA